ncbi:lipopolysaccharide heptosyltransferase family protein [Photobacterium sanctipauli]|uniref:Lipopolysaccharide heptosyltransferase family protein n=1 Tax=Photobacterium sanctipauli TaxID=1342794 RepID=A0A2T3NT14_9GAMM|nr:glycosyltransferase family 9 protein [Photobacterium sanctipauli]PSW19398.1 lipopolysaccharide heptosyltransferase family protein [Photobacterium sanctipauli]
MALFLSAPKSICILRLSAIGDVSNTIAMVQAIQRQWPSTQVTWITGKVEAQLIEGLPGIRIVIFDKQKSIKGYTHLWHQLRDESFDALLHLQTALRASVATLGIKAKYKLGFDKQRASDLQTLFTNIKVASPSQPHVLDGFMQFAATLGIRDLQPKWNIPIDAKDIQWAKQYIVTSQVLIITPAASKSYKNWNAEGYAALATHAVNRGFQVILAGSPATIEVELGKAIEQLVHVPVTNLIGKSNLKQMLALLSLANLVCAPDTGPAHMAIAAGTPVLGLYAHHNPKRTGPYLCLPYVVSVYEHCIQAETGKALNDLPWRSRVKDKTAMEKIEPIIVTKMFDKIVKDYSLIK